MFRLRTFLLCVSLFILFAFSTACGSKVVGKEGNPCSATSECAGSLKCVQQRCSFESGVGIDCSKDSKCPAGLFCIDKTCFFSDGSRCSARVSCKNNQKCSGSYCILPGKEGQKCLDAAGCLLPFVCSAIGMCKKAGQIGTAGKGKTCKFDKKDCLKGLKCHRKKEICGEEGEAGWPCSKADDCKTGKICTYKGECQDVGKPGTTKDGVACKSPTDCMYGLNCSSVGKCTKQGSGDENTACKKNEACFAGFICANVGDTQGRCKKPGKIGSLPIASTCKESSNCAFGMICDFSKKCSFINESKGTACEDPKKDKGPFRIYFELPRKGKSSAEFYRRPFPDDTRLKENGTLDFSNFPLPTSKKGRDQMSRYVDGLEAKVKGFSTHPTIFFRFSQKINFKSLELNGKQPVIVFYDLDTKSRVGIGLYYTPAREKYICYNYMRVVPYTNRPLKPGHTYAVIVTNLVKSLKGELLKSSPDFEMLLASRPPSDSNLERYHTSYKKLRDFLQKNDEKSGWPGKSDVAAAAVFTTQKPTTSFEKFRGVIHLEPKPKLESFVYCDGKTRSPCEGKGDFAKGRACGDANSKYYEFHAKINMPIFQKGKAPYEIASGDISYNKEGKPKVFRHEKICVSLTVPKGKLPKEGWPTVLYAHGIGGHYRTHILNNTARRLSLIDIRGKKTKFATISFDQVVHGGRLNGSKIASSSLFFNFDNPEGTIGNHLQAAADLFSMTRLIKSLKIEAGNSPTKEEILFNTKKIAFVGHSLGGSSGPLFLAYEPDVSLGVLSGAGGYITEKMLKTSHPTNIAGALKLMLGDSKLSKVHPMLNVIQTFYERIDSTNYGHLISVNPLNDLAPKNILHLYGLGDTFTPPKSIELLAYSMGLQAVSPVLKKLGTLTDKPLSTPVRGNRSSQKYKATTVFVQYKPQGYDGHVVLFKHPDARRHFARFLVSWLNDPEGVPAFGN